MKAAVGLLSRSLLVALSTAPALLSAPTLAAEFDQGGATAALGGEAPAPPTPLARPWESVVRAQRELAVDGERFGAYAQLGTALRLEPRVDLQARGVHEASSDVAIRGGTFESTGLTLGAVGVVDPQTGHYLMELPVPLTMVTAPEVRVGARNALHALSASAGSVAFGWRSPRPQVLLSMAAGARGQNQQHAYAAHRWALRRGTLSVDADVARASGSAGLANSDFSFLRAAARLRLEGQGRATDVFAGYQSKAFGWPYLYALRALHDAVGSSGAETEALRTCFVALNHRGEAASLGTAFEVSAYLRNHADDYELDRFKPGLFNPYEHETWVGGLGAAARQPLGRFVWLEGTAQLLQDSLSSTSLRFGPFSSRRSFKLALAVSARYRFASGVTVGAQTGGALDDSNRDRPALSPLASLSVQQEALGGWRHGGTLEYARATQEPGYTAIASNPVAGLFRGNPTLGRSTADQAELSYWVERDSWLRASATIFQRFDRDLADWTYSSSVRPFAARTANAVDVDVLGVEAVLGGRHARLTWHASYAFLSKAPRYDTAVDASFYALNFPAHRAVLSLSWRALERLELKCDAEYRVQAPNGLRGGTSRPLLAGLGFVWRPRALASVALRGAVDNVLDVSFERVPGVPGAGRQVSLGLEYAEWLPLGGR